MQHQLSAVGGRILLADAVGCLNDALCTAGVVAITRLLDGRTQARCLSAPVKHAMYGQGLEGTHAGLLRLEDAFRVVIVDHEDTVGRRRRHRAGMRRRRPQGQRSPLWPQWAAAWPLVPRSRTSSARRSAPSKLFQPYDVCHAYVPYILVQRAENAKA